MSKSIEAPDTELPQLDTAGSKIIERNENVESKATIDTKAFVESKAS